MSISESMKMIRNIRENHYEQTKGMSQEQKDWEGNYLNKAIGDVAAVSPFWCFSR